MDYIIYTDGAYSSKLNIGGIGFIIYNNDEKEIVSFNKAYRNTTNQRMEIRAVIVALSSLKNKSNIILYTDSMYLVGTMTLNWKRKCNIDLWNKLDILVNKHNVTFKHIKGHNGDIKNEKVDRLATSAITNNIY